MSEGIDSGYVMGQIARAFATRDTHGDAATRQRADAKIAAWSAVLRGMLSGELAVGSRTPTGEPPWVTLEVLRGGFASGAHAAGGPLLPHEQARLAALGAPADGNARVRLNASYLDEAGLAELGALLDSGCYRVEVPEEAALLTVAWLLRAGDRAAAADVMEVVAPWFGALRFYPKPAERPLEVSARVCRQPISDTIAGLSSPATPPRIQAMNQAIAIWAPRADQAAALVLETIDGDAPQLAADGTVTGGQPLRRLTPEWQARASAYLAEHEALRARFPHGKKVDRPYESFFELRRVLARAARSPAAITPIDVARTREILARIAAKRGLPASERLAALRTAQAAQATRPLHAELRLVLIERLRAFPLDGGLPALDGLLDPLTADEASWLGRVGLHPGHLLHPAPIAAQRAAHPITGAPMPRRYARKLARSLEAPIETLVERGVLPSPETLAEVTPQLSAFVKAAALRDPALRRLYGATYLAFRARRSLLLLNLASQVRLEELPWVAAIERHRGDALTANEQARETLRALVTLVLTAFPHVILPNPLITELRALAVSAGLATMPLTEEIAADIFTGTFVDKFRQSALDAAELLTGTLYERYYDARFADVRALVAPPAPDQRDPHGPRRTSPAARGIADVCRERVARAPGSRGSTAANGATIEQQQILTTHNLATLLRALELRAQLTPRLPALARACFTWIVDQAPQLSSATRHAQLLARKNMAYAWRQMTFFLALAEAAEHAPFVAGARAQLAAAPAPICDLLEPFVDGLEAAIEGGAIEPRERFLGWRS